jgi:V/A-type H+-transporting ATPase subunit I
MVLLSIIGTVRCLGNTVEVCGRSCVFEPESVFKFLKDTSGFSPIKNDNSITSLIKKMVDSARKINKNFDEAFIMQDCKDTLSIRQMTKYSDFFSKKVEKMIQKIGDLNSKLEICNKSQENLRYFKNLKVKLSDLNSCKYVRFKFGKIPKVEFEKLNSSDKESMFLKFCESEKNCYCAVFAPESVFDKVLPSLDRVRFEETKIPDSGGNAEEEIENLENERERIKSEILDAKERIDKFWEHQKKICFWVFLKLLEINKFQQIKTNAAEHQGYFILAGWVPRCEVEKLTKELKNISSVEYSIEPGEDVLEFNPPVKLKNRRLFSPFEFFIGTYGFPCYGEIDPTAFVAVTYTILFGIMFADAGQGFLLILAGLFADKRKKMKLGGVLTVCGFSSVFFGIIFGSVFGFENLLDPIYKLVGFKSKPIEVMASGSTMLIIYSAIMLGTILLIVSMIFNIVELIKQKKISKALLSHNGLCGILFYVSVIFLFLSATALKIGVFEKTLAMFLIVFTVLLMFFKELIEEFFEGKFRKPNWGDYILSNFFELLEIVLSYFTNTVSFVRIGVFVFVHSGMMMVIFSLAKMSGSLSVLVIILGNLIVTVLEALLVGMQIMRLEFCELFGRFFSGKGREFKPVRTLRTRSHRL